MYCTSCGIELRGEDRFCSQCGARTSLAPPPEPGAGRPPLSLDKGRKKIGGVCAGFARYMDADVSLIRIICLIVAFSTGIGFIAYLVAWIVLPADSNAAAARASTQAIQTV